MYRLRPSKASLFIFILLCGFPGRALPQLPPGDHWVDEGKVFFKRFDTGKKTGAQAGQIRLPAPPGFKICNFEPIIYSIGPNEPFDQEIISFRLDNTAAVIVHFNLPGGGFPGPAGTWANGGVNLNVVRSNQNC